MFLALLGRVSLPGPNFQTFLQSSDILTLLHLLINFGKVTLHCKHSAHRLETTHHVSGISYKDTKRRNIQGKEKYHHCNETFLGPSRTSRARLGYELHGRLGARPRVPSVADGSRATRPLFLSSFLASVLCCQGFLLTSPKDVLTKLARPLFFPSRMVPADR